MKFSQKQFKGILTYVKKGALTKFLKMWIFCIFVVHSSKKHTSPKNSSWNHFSMKWEQFSQKSLGHETLFNTVVYGSNEIHIGLIMHNLKRKIGINWNFGNRPKLFFLLSSDSYHKKMLLDLESTEILEIGLSFFFCYLLIHTIKRCC